MEKELIEFHLDWIVADYIPFIFNDVVYCIRSPSLEAKVIADQYYFNYYSRSIDEGALDMDGVYKLLMKYGIWDDKKEEILAKLKNDVEEIKLQIFQCYLDAGKRIKIKQALKDTKDYIEKMEVEKQIFDYLSADFVAACAKYNILLGYSIYRGKQPLWKSERRWNLSDEMGRTINKKLNDYRLTSDEYREIAVSDNWRSIYNIKRGNLFGKSIVNYSDHQKHLLSWSQMYDCVYKSPDCPPDEIINDFDAIDGWFIAQRRKRDAQLNKHEIEGGLSEKIKNSEHVFVVTSAQDANKIYEMNDIGGKVALHKRFAQIKKFGTVREENMVDTREYLRGQAAKLRQGE